MLRPVKIAVTTALLLMHVCAVFGVGAELTLGSTEQPSLKWRTKVITIALSSSLQKPPPNIKSGSDVVEAVRRSLRTWEEASGVEFREVFSDRQNVSPQGPAGDGVNLITVAPSAENALLFAKNPDDVAATTRVFFDSRGRISEADIVLNPYQQFSTDGTFGTFDLESTLTHELGHVLGLEHSNVRGATMYENYGKNGVFGLQGISHRTLSEIDRAAVRAKYGAPSEEKCCGSVSAKLTLPEGRPASNLSVWLQDSVSGQVIAEAVTDAAGAVDLGGLRNGAYTIFSGRKERAKRPVPMQLLGSVSVSARETTIFTKKLEAGPDDVELQYTGFNGQLTLSSVPLNAGRSYTVYIGGRNLKPKDTLISFNSPFLEVLPDSVTSHDYGDDITVLSFEVRVDANTPPGDYSVFVQSGTGGRSAVAGGLSVRTFANPYGNSLSDNKLQ